MTVFDWDKIRPKFQKQATRDATIGAAFQQYLDGNDMDCCDDMGKLFDTFRAAWIICEDMIGGNHEQV
jgi:hypothetical protein